MRLRVRLIPLFAVAVLVAVSACARTGPGGTGAGGGYGADDLVLRMEFVGGFVPVERLVGRVPTVSVYGDGRVITDGPIDLKYPGPALPNLRVATISAADVDTLVAKALDAGVGRKADYGQPPVADAPSTKFTVRSDTGLVTTEVYALDMGDGGITPAQRANRQALRGLADALNDLPGTLGDNAAGETQPYQALAVAAFSQPWREPGSGDLPAQPESDWPAAVALPGSADGLGGFTCLVVSGPDAAAVLTAAASANELTPWVSDGKRWRVTFRPLLPDESTCADLT